MGLAGPAVFAQTGKARPLQRPIQPPDAFAVLDRFERMSPLQRRRFLERLPPERRKLFEERLNRYQGLRPEQREQVREQYELFQNLGKEQQNALRQAFRDFSQLPLHRRPLVRRAYEILRDLPEAERRARMNSDAFRSRFTDKEQHLLDDMTRLFPLTQPPLEPDSESK